MPIEISPSILAANFLCLEDAVRAAERAEVKRLQVDVMDGLFVPNISVGQPVVRSVRDATDLLLEAHLMIVDPERYVPDFAEAGADVIIVHVEASRHLYRTLQQIHDHGKRAGVALNPATPPSSLVEVYGLADLILVMTVNPGFGGQRFLASMLPKIEKIRRELDARNLDTELEVDGGINLETAPQAAGAGATVLVAGTAVYDAPEGVSEAVSRLRHAARSAGR
ncbi:MAG: ribulose-phosphate 3-epimerase [Chloroflexota bacterium]